MRRLALVLPALVLTAVVVGACADDNASSKRETLPPNDKDDLAEIFDPELEELGLRLTRGGLQRQTGGYDDRARHLALYAEPTAPFTTADYAAAVVPSARVFLPQVFERWA